MSQAPAAAPSHADAPHDPIEDLVHKVPVVLPVVGAVMIFLLAMIAVTMA